MRFVQSAALAAIGLFAFSLAEVRAQGATVTVVPIAFAPTNPCNGEQVLFQGDLLILSSVHVDSNGGAHIVFNSIIHATGEGVVSGDKYVGTQAFIQNNNDTLDPNSGANVTTNVFRFTAAGLGQVPDFGISLTAQFTLNSNGIAVLFINGSLATVCK